MRVFKCDRCGKYYENEAASNGYEIYTIDNVAGHNIMLHKGKSYDMCPDCLEKYDYYFEHFVQGGNLSIERG